MQSANEPISVDQRCANAIRERLYYPGIFDNMMVECDDPAGLFGLVGVSRRAGLERSTILTSWLPGNTKTRSASLGWDSRRSRNSAHSPERPASVMSPVIRIASSWTL